VVNVKASDFEVFEALAVDIVNTESAKAGGLLLCILQYVLFKCLCHFVISAYY